ncbi:lactate/malate family dehydrogenase [Rhodopila sp.]|uniref:lactate/malate family dehydrogenase n=1 Tax=Rhodopila sp. TaxID=2480087 RepID=UPI003D14E028
MKVGVVGAGGVGAACVMALVLRGSAREIVVVDRTAKRAKAVATDIRYGVPLGPRVNVTEGEYGDLAGAGLVMVTVGANEKAGGATDRGDPEGRLKLLDKNVEVYRDIVPQVVRAAPDAVLLVVTDPPDPLADLTRALAGHDAVLSTGTWLDSLRFRTHIACKLDVSPDTVEAQILGEHGTSEVFVWSSARIAGVPLSELLRQRGEDAADFRKSVEEEVRYANIAIIEGNEASQYGIGIICARIAEAVTRDEGLAVPIGGFSKDYGLTLSLPGVIGRRGLREFYPPSLSEEERGLLDHSVAALKKAGERLSKT